MSDCFSRPAAQVPRVDGRSDGILLNALALRGKPDSADAAQEGGGKPDSKDTPEKKRAARWKNVDKALRKIAGELADARFDSPSTDDLIAKQRTAIASLESAMSEVLSCEINFLRFEVRRYITTQVVFFLNRTGSGERLPREIGSVVLMANGKVVQKINRDGYFSDEELSSIR